MIRNWLNRWNEKREAKMLLQRIPKIIQRFGELIEQYPNAYMDESWLPISKVRMKEALKIAIAGERDPNMRGWLEVGWGLLSQFQPNIGQTPVTLVLPEKPSLEGVQAMDRYLKLAKDAQAEDERNSAELRIFLATLPN